MDLTNEFSQQEIEELKTPALLCYIFGWIGTLIIMIGDKKESRLAKFYANEGLLIGIGCVLLSWTCVVPIVLLIFAIMGIVNTVNGVVKPMPLIGGIQIIK
ncbi:MAG: hypothetical protein LBI27_07260 [Clostridiales bacterium]|jgi:uncharacterized membrane protein|nr:hypothetical protein [Clostridiales bacterium]